MRTSSERKSSLSAYSGNCKEEGKDIVQSLNYDRGAEHYPFP
jgi:hypothetical protein